MSRDLLDEVLSKFGFEEDAGNLDAPPSDTAGKAPGEAADSSAQAGAEANATILRLRGIAFVRVLWVGCDGVRRCRVIPTARWEAAQQHGVGIVPGLIAVLPHAPVIAEGSGVGVIGEVKLLPDAGAVPVSLPWRPRHSIVTASLHTRPDDVGAGTAWACCPREALRRTLRQLEAAHGLRLQVGYETEFVLLEPRPGDTAGALRPVSAGQYCQTRSLDDMSPLLDEMHDTLEQMGIAVVQLHAEAGAGQFEIVTGHGPAMQAVENLLLTREAICGVASKHGKMATLLPKLSQHDSGNGQHLHWSLQTVDGGAAMADGSETHGLAKPAAQFLAGVLAHLPALLPFLLASPNSYRRAVPSTWSGAYHVWGVLNKEAPLRLCTQPGLPDATNVELKALDACANPYIALAALVTAGMAGVAAGATLPEPVEIDPASLPKERAAELGMNRLPASMTEALEALLRDAELCGALKDTLGAPLVRAYLAEKVAEEDAFGACGMQRQVTALQFCY